MARYVVLQNNLPSENTVDLLTLKYSQRNVIEIIISVCKILKIITTYWKFTFTIYNMFIKQRVHYRLTDIITMLYYYCFCVSSLRILNFRYLTEMAVYQNLHSLDNLLIAWLRFWRL